ncbi:MAG: hypothetical protein KZQ95_07025 [Candidatus Thiodiazotropha sp. (ex Epidulcina cf. delphinae)]|nr:hypothetical protein [Candidatus Thiodiazotropha sp. (ex Epidulcina cf. delphinae)]
MKNHALAIILPLLRNASGLDYFKWVAFVTLPSLAIGFISHCSGTGLASPPLTV